MATDALAALASKENFDKVKLRKAEVTSTGGAHLTGGDRFLPYKDLMLLQVKGRDIVVVWSRVCDSVLSHELNKNFCSLSFVTVLCLRYSIIRCTNFAIFNL